MKLLVNNKPLDEDQLKPILENALYSMIIAGAGSGKTTTLIGKIKYLIEEKNFLPSSICAITFTNDAVDHLKKSLEENHIVDVPCYTFHKLALHILEKNKEHLSISHPNLLLDVIDHFFESRCFGNSFLVKIIEKKFSFLSPSNEKNYQKIIHSKDFLSFKRTITTFLQLFLSNNYQVKDLKTWMKQKKYQDTLLLIYAIYCIYETEKRSTHSIDFDDMIRHATTSLQKKGSPVPYQMILVDEFQDCSYIRFHFIEVLVKTTQSMLCVVGDDYQSIYHFSGCDIEIFLNFKNYFPQAKIYQLEKTYRMSEELITVATEFVMKNKFQIKKHISSEKHLEKPIVFVYYSSIQKSFEKIIKEIPENQNILLLGRYQKDEKKIDLNKIHHPSIRFSTIHAAKGLESDIVILLNLEDDIYGLPSKQKEENILYLVKKRQIYPYEEERRLFFVALTRTKTKIYCLIPRKNPSIFVEELKRNKNIEKRYF